MTKVAMAFPSLTGPRIDRDRRLARRAGGRVSLVVNLRPGNGFQSPLLDAANALARIDSPSLFPLMMAVQQR
jgi:hypothetical protein